MARRPIDAVNVSISKHGYRRLKDRSIRMETVYTIYRYGEEWRENVYIIPRNTVKGLLKSDISMEDKVLIKDAAHNRTAIVVSSDGELITAIPNPTRKWLRKKHFRFNIRRYNT